MKVDGKNNNISNTLKGNDLDAEGTLNIDGQSLYNIANDKNYGNHVIEINANGKDSEYIRSRSDKIAC